MIETRLIELFSEAVETYEESREEHEIALEYGSIDLDRIAERRKIDFNFVRGIVCATAAQTGLSTNETVKRLCHEANITPSENIRDCMI